MTPDQLAKSKQLVAHSMWTAWELQQFSDARFRGVDQNIAKGKVRPHRRGHYQKRARSLTQMPILWVYVEGSSPHEYVPDLSDYATAAILLRMAMEMAANAGEVDTECRTDKHGDLWWAIMCMASNELCKSSDDLGTAAATALLAIWGEP